MSDTYHLDRAAELLELASTPGTLDEEVQPIALAAIAHTLLGLQSTLSQIVTELRQAGAQVHAHTTVPADPAPPGTPEVDEEVEDLAVRLWETDQTLQSPARTFSEDYQVVQDRYRDQAAALLDPDGSEGDDHRR